MALNRLGCTHRPQTWCGGLTRGPTTAEQRYGQRLMRGCAVFTHWRVGFPLFCNLSIGSERKDYRSLSAQELANQHAQLLNEHEAFRARNLKLDMTRGKPAAAQLNLANDLNNALKPGDTAAADGTDVRNYGVLDGLPEMKSLFGEILDAPATNVIVGGNSSLQLMHDTVLRALLCGVPGGAGPWVTQKPKFVCPTPGYDRHFAICEHYGIEMISVATDAAGPDMDAVEALVAKDPSIKGIWCVPKYSNPTGITYSDEVILRLSRMPVAAPDFRIFWDNAYVVHDLYDTSAPLMNILVACHNAGNENRPLVFGSTSKISFAGAGIAAMASSTTNATDARKHLSIQTIGSDKINQLRHIRFFKDLAGIKAHMQRHAAIIRPKFEAVIDAFDKQLGGLGIASWTRPRGGYFVSLDTLDGCATRVVKLTDEVGVKLTAAGATFPYGKDPNNKNIRIAPTMPPLEQVELAMQVVASCVKLASVEKLLA
jgi:DNA-binding transcriptional MocR family regulator